jgi:hypothetical protein
MFHCRSYSPLPSRLYTVKPAFLASLIERGFKWCGVLKLEITLRTGFLQSGQCVTGGALNGRRNVKRPPQMLHWPSHGSYSYNGIYTASNLRQQPHASNF